jgi:hypothetical protein
LHAFAKAISSLSLVLIQSISRPHVGQSLGKRLSGADISLAASQFVSHLLAKSLAYGGFTPPGRARVVGEPHQTRRELLEKKIVPRLREPLPYAAPFEASLPVLIQSLKAQKLEGLVAKRLSSKMSTPARIACATNVLLAPPAQWRRRCCHKGRVSSKLFVKHD